MDVLTDSKGIVFREWRERERAGSDDGSATAGLMRKRRTAIASNYPRPALPPPPLPPPPQQLQQQQNQ